MAPREGKRRMTARTIVYLACAESREIMIFEMNRASGALRLRRSVEVPGSEIASPVSIPLAFSPDRTRLYATMRMPPFPLVTFAVDPADGDLTLLGETVLPGSVAYIAVAPTGRFIFSVSTTGNIVACLPIDADGVVRQVAQQVCGDMGFAHSVLVDAAGLNIYVAIRDPEASRNIVYDPTIKHIDWPENVPGSVVRWRLDPQSGRLTDKTLYPAPPGAGPRHMRLSRDGRTLWLLNELDATVCTYRVDADGGLELAQMVRTIAEGVEGLAADLHATPDERFLYASERLENTLTCLARDPASGALTKTSQVPTEDWTRSFAIDPRGKFLLAPGQNSNRMSVFAIDAATGALSLSAQYQTGRNPSWVEILDL